MRILLTILILIISGCRQNATQQDAASSQSPEHQSLNIDGGFDSVSVGPNYSYTTQFYTQLTKGDFQNRPQWLTGTANPPLSAHDAMAAASKYIDSLVSDGKFPEGSCIDQIELRPFDPENGHWYYVVRFTFKIAGGFIPYVGIAVLMDGAIPAPEISDRIDIGWPLPNADVTPKTDNLSDSEIVNVFIKSLNPDRKYVGQIVETIGRLKKIDWDHPDRRCGQRFHLVLNDGKTLLFDPPGGWSLRFNVDLKITGQLIGYRDLNDRDSEWRELKLVPGLRAKSIGVVRN